VRVSELPDHIDLALNGAPAPSMFALLAAGIAMIS
jgi:hypothetical protein